MHFIHLFENDLYALFPELFLTYYTCIANLWRNLEYIQSTRLPYSCSNSGMVRCMVCSLRACVNLHMPFSIMVCFYNTFVIDELTFF